MQYEELIKIEVPQDDSTSHEEKMILYNEIKRFKPQTVVEIGTHRGLTTLYMAHALWENGSGHLHTCDPNPEWCQTGNFRKFPELEKHITFYGIQGKNMDIQDIDFLFVDGFHEREYVLEEIDALFPKLSPNAVVYFHDTNGRNIYCDVPGAIEECGLQVEYIKTQNGLAKYIHNGGDTNDTPKRAPKGVRKSKKTDV